MIELGLAIDTAAAWSADIKRGNSEPAVGATDIKQFLTGGGDSEVRKHPSVRGGGRAPSMRSAERRNIPYEERESEPFLHQLTGWCEWARTRQMRL